MIRIGESATRRVCTLLLVFALAPGLCLAVPATAPETTATHHGADSVLAGPPHMHGGDSCAPDTCCATIVKAAAKKGDGGDLGIVETSIGGTAIVPDASRLAARPGPVATPPGPPERNLPLLC